MPPTTPKKKQYLYLLKFLKEKAAMGIIHIEFERDPEPGFGLFLSFSVLAGYYQTLIANEVSRAAPHNVAIRRSDSYHPYIDMATISVDVWVFVSIYA